MQYLRIASPGVADPTALTVLGVGTSRYAGRSDVIGMFGSGSKLSTGLLLRNNLPPVIITGNLRMNYGIKPLVVEGRDFQQVTVTYSGKDLDGKNRSSTETLGYTLEWGEADWSDVKMAPREYVANAIDSVAKQGLSLDEIEISLVDGIRAKKEWTQVYIPANEGIVEFYKELNVRFLHFGRRDLLARQLLPKIALDNKVRIFKKGVLVKVLDGPSVWDYNLGEDLRLDESRNASEWDVKHAISKALSHADAGALAVVLRQVVASDGKDGLLEGGLSAYDLKDKYNEGTKAARKVAWQAAFKAVAGENGVASSGLAGVDTHIRHKGKTPYKLPANWLEVLGEMEVPTEDKVLSVSERAGETLSDPTPDMIRAVDDVWALLVSFNVTNGKSKPPVQAFTSVMDAGSQKLGQYRQGTVFLHTDIGGMSPMLRQTALEEVVHHTTQSTDLSRDLQDYLFRLVTAVVW